MSSALITVQPTLDLYLMSRKKNDGDLLIWAMGWIAKQYRGEETYTAIGDRIGQTGTGYKRMETPIL